MKIHRTNAASRKRQVTMWDAQKAGRRIAWNEKKPFAIEEGGKGGKTFDPAKRRSLTKE